MPAIYRVIFKKVVDLTDEEVEAVLDYSEYAEDGRGMYIIYDFEDLSDSSDPDEMEVVENFRRRVRPEVFEKVKELSRDGDIFVIE